MEGEPKTLADWKNFGNKQFVLKRYNDAIKAYTAGLSLCNYEDPDLLANRAAAYLNLERYALALSDVELALKAHPSHVKAVHRKVRALCGLAKYEEAIAFLKKEIPQHKKPDKELLQKLRQKSESMLNQQRTGQYNTEAYLYSPFDKIEDWAEYYGPITIEQIPGKGRGLVATRNLAEGELVLGCRAYAIVFLDPNRKKEEDPEDNIMVHEEVATSHDFSGRWLVQKVYEKIKNAPETGHFPYQLFAGDQLGSLDPIKDKDACKKPDIKRISGLCRHNTFCNSGDSYPEVEESTGLWILPSFFNHLCVGGNCTWRIYGDFILVRVFHPISKGEELIFSYASPTWKFAVRNELLTDRLGFVCQCQLCIMDRQLPPSIITLRESLQQIVLKQEVDFVALHPNVDPQESYKKFQASSKLLEDILKRLHDLHPQHGILNVLKVDALQQLGMKYFGVGEFEKAAEYMQTVHTIMLAVGLPHGAIECMLWVVGSYLQMRNIKMAKYWIEVLKRDCLLSHGTVNVLNLMGKWILTAMEDQNVSL